MMGAGGKNENVVFGPCHPNTFHPDLDWLEEQLQRPDRPKVVYIVNPCNPTGAPLPLPVPSRRLYESKFWPGTSSGNNDTSVLSCTTLSSCDSVKGGGGRHCSLISNDKYGSGKPFWTPFPRQTHAPRLFLQCRVEDLPFIASEKFRR